MAQHRAGQAIMGHAMPNSKGSNASGKNRCGMWSRSRIITHGFTGGGYKNRLVPRYEYAASGSLAFRFELPVVANNVYQIGHDTDFGVGDLSTQIRWRLSSGGPSWYHTSPGVSSASAAPAPAPPRAARARWATCRAFTPLTTRVRRTLPRSDRAARTAAAPGRRAIMARPCLMCDSAQER